MTYLNKLNPVLTLTLGALLLSGGLAAPSTFKSNGRTAAKSAQNSDFTKQVIQSLVEKALFARGNSSLTLADVNDMLAKYLGESITCFVCREIVSVVAKHIGTDTGTRLIGELITYICESLKIEDGMVCSDVGREWGPEAEYLVAQMIASPDQICPALIEQCGDPNHGFPFYNWTVTLPQTPKPANDILEPPPPGSKQLKILQLTDLHYDFMYKPGSEVNCKDPLCCRINSTSSSADVQRPAGYWGTVAHCDIPYWTADAIFNYISKNEDFDVVYWTGDLPPHNVWKQTRDDQRYHYANMTALFNSYFSSKKIFPAMGNHESAPVDSFPPMSLNLPDKYNNRWLYSYLAESWINWLGPDTQDDILKRASYATKIAPNLRLISLNTDYPDSINFWMILNQTDPDGVLAWLVTQLQDAEAAGDKVHIIAHEPPTSVGIYWSWWYQFYRIVNRYENTIRGQFYGHEHWDSFRLFFEDADPSKRATGVAYVTPSITTWDTHNPTYRIFTVDGRENGTWAVLDYRQMMFNLTKANEDITKPLTPEVEYVASQSYDLPALFPDHFYDLVSKMSTSNGAKYLDNYIKFKHISEPRECGEVCRLETLCDIKAARGKDVKLCTTKMK